MHVRTLAQNLRARSAPRNEDGVILRMFANLEKHRIQNKENYAKNTNKIFLKILFNAYKISIAYHSEAQSCNF